MKIICNVFVLASVVFTATTSAFAPSSAGVVRSSHHHLHKLYSAAAPSDDAAAGGGGGDDDLVAKSAMPENNPYERIGITSEQLAIGVDASEFLQWIGSKQDLIEKFQRDNKGMDENRATQEVEKFLMDAEMVNAYIKFEKDKIENPPNYREEAEQTLKDPKTIATYAAWLIGGASFGWVRKAIIEPKYESGEWEETHIELPTLPFFENQAAQVAAEKAAAAAAATATETVDAATMAVDAAANAL